MDINEINIPLSVAYKKTATHGLWHNNIVFSQSLALCPLLAVTGTATNGLRDGLFCPVRFGGGA